MNLAGKVAIVTGGARGIGAAIATAYAREGAKVVITSRTRSELDITAKAIQSQGGEVLPIQGDVSNIKDVERVVQTALGQFGKIDILVNNAGVSGSTKDLHEMSEAEWDKVINTNVKGYFLFTKTVLPHMLNKHTGNIINMTSGAGLKRPRTYVMSIVYSVSKFAIEGLTHVVSVRLRGTGVNINALNPGPVKTKLLDFLSPDEWDANSKELGERKQPESASNLAIYLGSLKPGEVSGETFDARVWNEQNARQVMRDEAM
ncbi:MAG: SDR family NAD(P)-dependent oxidoreductase [Nitrososphaerales archaeon]